MIEQPFYDRFEAGRMLADKLSAYAYRPDLLVLALPRGGVPVAFEIAQQLHATLDLFIVRKLGVPGHRELAMGAIATGGVKILNQQIIDMLQIPSHMIERITFAEQQELARRQQTYRGDRHTPSIKGRIIILVDDGLATGATMRAAVVAVQRQAPARLIVAVPVAAPSTCNEFRTMVDEVVCVRTPKPFISVGSWYQDFSQVSDETVRQLLVQANARVLAQERTA